jgi:hypothetical protein
MVNGNPANCRGRDAWRNSSQRDARRQYQPFHVGFLL